MKHFNLKLSFILCFLVLGLGYVNAQGISFTWNEARGYHEQLGVGHGSTYFGLLNKTYENAYWGPNYYGSDSHYYNGALSNSSSSYNSVLIRQNTSRQACDMFDWFTLTFTTPSYSKISYKVTYKMEAYAYATGARVRAAFFDYESDPNSRWSSRGYTPTGQNQLYAASANGNLYNGEKSVVLNTSSGSVWSSDYNLTQTIDNSTVDADNITYRYCGFSSSKTESSANGHYTSLRMYYTVTSATYYKYLTFNPNGGKGDMSEQTVENSANIKANAFTRDGFTFAGWNTQPDGTGTNYANSDAITATQDSKGPVTLYAQWEPQTITVKFDYTYRTSPSQGVVTYVHMADDDQFFTSKVKAILRDHNNNVLASYILTAPGATTPQGTPTEEISTHKTATITLNVVKGESESLNPNGTSGAATYTLTLNATNYANYSSIDFEVMNANATAAAAHWVTDEVSATSYIFKNEAHESANMFDLKWRVNLKELSMYPSDIFVKPMRNTSATDYAQIPVMAGIKGIECKLAGYIDAQGNDVTIETYNAKSAEDKLAFNKTGGAYYTGEYNVLKKDADGNDYSYKLGLTGFNLDGNPYYLAANQGDIPNDMISDVADLNEDINIKFDREAKDIPVLILSPNGAGATVGGRSNYEIYVDNNPTTEGARTVNLNKFEALRANYDFVNWKDAYDGTTYEKDGDYTFNIGTKATTTLLAQWVRNSAPTASYTIEEVGNDFKYVVTATDAIKVESVKYFITTTADAPAADVDWQDMQKQTDGTYTYTFPMFNDNYGKYIWAKAANADKSVIISMGQIRSILKLQGIKNPNSHKQETETIDDTPTVVDYYDYYATLFYSEHAFIANNVTAYTVEEQGGQLKLVKIVPTGGAEYAIIPNGTAVVLRMEHSTDNVIVLEECDNTGTTYPNNQLTGVNYDANPTANTDYYIFGYNATYAMGFYLQSPSTLAAHTAFIKKVTNKQNPTQYTLDFENQTVTGIDDIIVNGTANGATYDLLGRKVKATNAKSGIYIKDGKKIFIKE